MIEREREKVNYKTHFEREIKEQFDDLDECPDTKSRGKNIPGSATSRELLNAMHRYTYSGRIEYAVIYTISSDTLPRLTASR